LIDASGEGPTTLFFGMLADAPSDTLWTCQLIGTPNAVPPRGRTSLRGIDLKTGAPKFRWNLPGDDTI
jgi:hypothetical protein